MIFPSIQMELTEENPHPILRVYFRKLTNRNRPGSKHCFKTLYVDHNYPRLVVLGEPGPV